MTRGVISPTAQLTGAYLAPAQLIQSAQLGLAGGAIPLQAFQALSGAHLPLLPPQLSPNSSNR